MENDNIVYMEIRLSAALARYRIIKNKQLCAEGSFNLLTSVGRDCWEPFYAGALKSNKVEVVHV